MVVTHDSSLEIKYVDINKLIPYVNNARTHTDEQVKQIASSIKEFGWTNPVLIDGDNGVIAGHGRLLAGQKLGINKVPTIELQGLTEAQKKAYILADNRLAQNAGWDEDLLKLELQDLESMDFDMTLMGFEMDELNKFLFEEPVGLTDPDEVPDLQDESTTQKGDVWLLGEHRLICGDATSETDIAKLMNNKKADMIFTDPPYNVDYGGTNHPSWKRRSIQNDNMADEEFVQFIENFIVACKPHVKQGSATYICYGERNGLQFLTAFNNAGLHHSMNIIWKKDSLVLGRSDYHYIHEPIFYGWFQGEKHIYYGDRKQQSVWEIKRPKRSDLHPTMKPIELIEKALANSSKNEDIVYEPFSGSGSTLIASEKTNRICYGLELDEKYCDVIIKRWQDFTGNQATLENTNKTFEQIQEERDGISGT